VRDALNHIMPLGLSCILFFRAASASMCRLLLKHCTHLKSILTNAQVFGDRSLAEHEVVGELAAQLAAAGETDTGQ